MKFCYNLDMPKAFDRHDDAIATVRWVGEVKEVTDDDFSGVLYDEYLYGDVRSVVRIPLDNIVETERTRAVPGILFYCDIELQDDDSVKAIRGIEFDDELTETQHGAATALLLETIARDKERWGIDEERVALMRAVLPTSEELSAFTQDISDPTSPNYDPDLTN